MRYQVKLLRVQWADKGRTNSLPLRLMCVWGVTTTDPQTFLDNSQFAWSYVWRVFPSVEQFEVDKQVR